MTQIDKEIGIELSLNGVSIMGVPQNRCFIMENPTKRMIWGYPYFRTPPHCDMLLWFCVIWHAILWTKHRCPDDHGTTFETTCWQQNPVCLFTVKECHEWVWGCMAKSNAKIYWDAHIQTTDLMYVSRKTVVQLFVWLYTLNTVRHSMYVILVYVCTYTIPVYTYMQMYVHRIWTDMCVYAIT